MSDTISHAERFRESPETYRQIAEDFRSREDIADMLGVGVDTWRKDIEPLVPHCAVRFGPKGRVTINLQAAIGACVRWKLQRRRA